MANIITVRNYTKQYIYNHISLRYPDLTKIEFQFKLQSIYKEIINKIRYITTTCELDVINTPMGFLFQHIRQDIVYITANCSCINDKLFLDKYLIYNYEWNIRLFNCLKTLCAKDIIVWFFLHIPYYNTGTTNTMQIILLYDKLLDYLLINWTPDIYLTEYEFIYISNETCMPYAISYYNNMQNTIQSNTISNVSNVSNVSVLVKYCKLLRKICPWLNYFSPKLSEKVFKYNTNVHLGNNTNTNNTDNTSKLKICFISDCFITDTSVLRDRISIIGKLDRTQYDVYIASFIPLEQVYGTIAKIFMNKLKNNYIYLGTTNTLNTTNTPTTLLDNARMVLEKYEFDCIVYPDLGMKLLPTLLAYSRIALTQITTWGHSETSGIDTIDYYISSVYFELSILEAQKHYSEKLILLKSLGTYYISPDKLFINNSSINNSSINNSSIQNTKFIFKTKIELGFNEDDNIYCCLQTFYKINETFEKCLMRILELDPKGIIILSNSFPFCKSHLQRIQNIMNNEKLQRIKWYPSLEKKDFLNLVKISTVCLDPFPFGGCNTSYDAFDYNIPVITMPSQYLYGRFTLGLYTKMNLSDSECIVNNIDDYAQIATQISVNIKLQHKINRNIEMNKHLIFQEQQSVDDWNNLFTTLHNKYN